MSQRHSPTLWRSFLVALACACAPGLPRLKADEVFLRGAARGALKIDISDAVLIFGYLFLGGEAPTCLDAADVNDDGKVDLSDGIYDLSYLFVGGPAPAEPFPSCGIDPTPDELGCESFRGCLCGGIAGFTCDGEGYQCEFGPGTCDLVDNLGTCVVVPDICTRILDPVCGCDGVTYTNDCERLRAGAQKDHDGPCGTVCGGIIGTPCPKGFFCEHPEGTCDILDNQGTCVEIPGACPAVFKPVCGCDGVTYSNDCERRGAQAQKAYDGPCVKEE